MGETQVTPSSDAPSTPPAGAQNTVDREQSEHMIPKSRLDEVLARQRAAEQELQQLRSAAQQADEKKRLERGEHEQVIAELRPQAERATALEETLQSYLDTELETVPEHFKAIIPDHLDVAAKLRMVQQARINGLFNPPNAPKTDAGVQGGTAQRRDKPQPSATTSALAELAKEYGHNVDLDSVTEYEQQIAARRNRFAAKRKQQLEQDKE